MGLRWKCKDCNECFKTRRKLYEHRHKVHNIKIHDTKIRDRSKFCEFCKEKYKERKREHLKICPNRRHTGFKWTDEEKKRISESLKKYLKEHPENQHWKRNTKFISKPCEHLKKHS